MSWLSASSTRSTSDLTRNQRVVNPADEPKDLDEDDEISYEDEMLEDDTADEDEWQEWDDVGF